MQRPRKIKDGKKIIASAGEALQYGAGNSVWVHRSRRDVGGNRKKFIGGERRAKTGMRLLEADGLAKLRQVASGSAVQIL